MVQSRRALFGGLRLGNGLIVPADRSWGMGKFLFFPFSIATRLGIMSGHGSLDDLNSILGRKSDGPTARR